MNKNSGVFDRIEGFYENMAVIALFLMVCLVFFNACLRYFLHSSIIVSEELARYFFIWMSFLGAIIAYRRKGHIAITVLTDMLKGRVKAAIYCIARIITTLAIAFLLYCAWVYTVQATQYNTAGTNINFGLIVCVLPIMAFSMLVTDFVDLYYYFTSKHRK